MPRLRPDQIASLYAASAEPDALGRIAGVVRDIMSVDSAGLWFIEQGRILDLSLTEDIVASAKDYLAYYQRLDPWSGRRPKVVNRATLSSDFISEEALLKTEFYNDFARHYGMRRPLGLVLDLGSGVLASVAVNRIAGELLLGPDDKDLLDEIGAHLRGALALFGRLRSERHAGDALPGALDRLAFGAVICTGEGRPIQVNRAALALAEQRAGLRIGATEEGLRAQLQPETTRLRALIAAAAAGRGGAIRLTGAEGGRLAVVATPLPGADATHLQPDRAFLCLAPLDAPPSLQRAALRDMFGLSPTQADLCVLLATGHTFEVAAEQRGVATSTARTHFRTILDKTGTRNLRDLLRLLAALPPVG
ncbi:helix-turn-helix transcriptional regulator [Methylobacterium sp. A54F]